jgi:hypothetical protein
MVNHGLRQWMNRVRGNQRIRLGRAGGRRRLAPRTLSAEVLETRVMLSAAATHLAFTPAAGSVQSAGTTFDVIVSVENSSNNVVTGDHSVVTLTETGPGPFSTGRNYVSQSAVGGVANIFVALDKSGTYTFTATDGRLGKAVQTSFVITADTTDPEHLAFLNVPATGTAGLPLKTFDVVVEDKFGNVDTTTGHDGDNVVLTEAGPGAFDASSQINAFIASGVAVFNNVILDTAGTYKLSANDADNAAVSAATSGKITINAGQAAALEFVNGTSGGSPLTGTAGKAFTASQGLKVDVTDAYGNLVTTDRSVVSLVIAASPSPSYATYVSPTHLTATAVGGVATFTPTFFTGTDVFQGTSLGQEFYTLNATDVAHGIAATASNTAYVQINAATATQLQFIVEPPATGSTTVTPITPPFEVAVEDAYGNIVTTSNALVTVYVQSGPGNQPPTSNGQAGAVDGIATFSGFEVNNFGSPTTNSFTLEATAPGLTTAYSTQFQVT